LSPRTIGPAPSNPPATPTLGGVTRRRIKLEGVGPGLQETFASAKAKRAELSYRAADPSKYRSQQTGLGGTADTHYLYGQDYWRIRETVRAYERNNALLGQIVNRALDQVLGNGLQVDPQTGDTDINETLAKLWAGWSGDPARCDFSGRLTFDEIERLSLRHRWIDGDAFVVLDERSGAVRLMEGDRVESATTTAPIKLEGRDVDLIHGVEVDRESGRVLAFHFIKHVPITRRGYQAPAVGSPELVRIPAEQVIHIFEPARVTQYRGMTAFHAVFDRISLLEDIEFAELVKLQVASCIGGFVTSEHDTFQLGSRTTETAADNSTDLTFDEFQPGMVVRLRPGEKIDTFSPSVTTQDTHQQKRQIIREIGLAVGLPLELSLLDHADSSFSANRATLETYKRTARHQQRWLSRTLRARVYVWKVRQWVAAGLVPDLPTITDHVIHFPEWTFLDPQKEAIADKTRLESHLASPRQVAAERGRDVDDVVREITEDRADLIRQAKAQADALVAEGIQGITWRDILDPGAPAPQLQQVAA
jgi:lambda family phage portal protein